MEIRKLRLYLLNNLKYNLNLLILMMVIVHLIRKIVEQKILKIPLLLNKLQIIGYLLNIKVILLK